MDSPLASAQWVIAGDGRDVFLTGYVCFFQAAVDVASVVRIKDDDGFIGNAFGVESIEGTQAYQMAQRYGIKVLTEAQLNSFVKF